MEKPAQNGDPQISTIDDDARSLLIKCQVVKISYNLQASVANKDKLVVATHTINRNDRNALSNIQYKQNKIYKYKH